MAKPANPVHRLLEVVLFTLIFLMAARTPLDSDLWWHLRAGEETLRTGHPLMSDPFSFTRVGEAWINHSWLSQVGMISLYRLGGYFALGLAMALLATVSMFLVYRQSDGPIGLKALALILASVVASTVWVARPQLASLLLMALLGYLLYLYKWRGQDRLWLLPLLFCLWSNLHGGYALGFLWLGAFLAGEGLNHLLGVRGGATLSWRQMGKLAGFTLLSALAILINPNGIGVWLIPFRTVNVGALQQFVSEWASPDFHNLLQQSLLWLLLAVFGAAALSGQRMDGSDLIPVLGFAYLALLARRNFGPFALVAAPVLVRYAACAVDRWQGQGHFPAWAQRLWNGEREGDPAARGTCVTTAINLSLAAVLFFAAIVKLYVVTQPVLVESYVNQQFPAGAVRWLQAEGQSGRVLNEYNWGGYLQWQARQSKVFVDGRTDLFGDAVIGEWMTAVEAAPGWKEILARYRVDLVMLEPDRPLLSQLEAAGWKKIYQDEQAVIYANPNGAH